MDTLLLQRVRTIVTRRCHPKLYNGLLKWALKKSGSSNIGKPFLSLGSVVGSNLEKIELF